jgi:F-type H+-transporting ATPase subunit a
VSALAEAPRLTPGKQAAPPPDKSPMAQFKKFLKIATVVYLVALAGFVALTLLGVHGKAESVASGAFSPTDEFRLDTWFALGPVNFNKGVLYILLASAITVGSMLYMANRLRQRPVSRFQVAVEGFYTFTRDLSFGNMDEDLAKKYFPLIATIFVFILVTNLLGYIPLPVDSTAKFTVFGVHIPSFQIYAADTNVAFPLMIALGVFILFTYEGIRHHGTIGFFKSLMPGGVTGAMAVFVFGIEVLSYILRLVSLTVRLWANLLAGHLLIAFMGGELGVLVGLPLVSWLLLPFGVAIFLFEAVLIAGLQAFIFAILTAIYLGSSVRSH